MITNLVAAVIVTVVTNVTETITEWERHEPASCDHAMSPGTSCAALHWRGVGPTEKAVTTRVAEITTLTFDWMGQKHETKTERTLKSDTIVMRKEWTESPRTNAIVISGIWLEKEFMATNRWFVNP